MSATIASVSATGFASELAQLILQNETNQEDSQRLSRDAARDAFLQHSNDQVAELHAAADASAQGALVGAAFTVAGAGCGLISDIDNYDAQTVDAENCSSAATDRLHASEFGDASKGFAGLSQYASQLGGGTAASHHNAEAQRYESLAAQDKWQAEDATTALDKADRLGDKIMDIVQSLNQDQASANNAIIGRI